MACAPIPKISSDPDRAITDLARQIIRSIPGSSAKIKIVVIDFPDLDGKVTEFGQYVAEELTTRLFRTRKFKVMERRLLNKVLEEQKLTLKDVFDPNSAQKMGNLLGVDAIVSGTIAEVSSDLKVNARIISTTTGQILGVAAVKIAKDQAEKWQKKKEGTWSRPRRKQTW